MSYNFTIEDAEEGGHPNILVFTVATTEVTIFEAATGGPPAFETMCAAYEALSAAIGAALFKVGESVQYKSGDDWLDGTYLGRSSTPGKFVVRGLLTTKHLPWNELRRKPA